MKVELVGQIVQQQGRGGDAIIFFKILFFFFAFFSSKNTKQKIGFWGSVDTKRVLSQIKQVFSTRPRGFSSCLFKCEPRHPGKHHHHVGDDHGVQVLLGGCRRGCWLPRMMLPIEGRACCRYVDASLCCCCYYCSLN